MSSMSSVDDESSIHFEKRTDLLLQGMRRPVRTMSGPVSSSLKKKKWKKIQLLSSNSSHQFFVTFGLVNMKRKYNIRWWKCNLAKFVSRLSMKIIYLCVGQSNYISSGSPTKSLWRIRSSPWQQKKEIAKKKSLFSYIAITNECVLYSIHQWLLVVVCYNLLLK
jgi:hypothetical protein